MNGPVVLVIMMVMMPFLIILWNRQRCKGKLLCFFVRKDKSLLQKLCLLKSAFVIWEDRAYDVYPDFVRICRFPMGWPAFLQELVPACLYDEEDAVPKDWITLEAPKEGSMKLRAALGENLIKKLVAEAAAEGGGVKINWRRILPIGIIIIGIIGLVVLLAMKGMGGGA